MPLLSARFTIILFIAACFTTVLVTTIYLYGSSVPRRPWSLSPAQYNTPALSIQDDVVLLIKTGATVIRDRLPAHFAYLHDIHIPNYIIYSDLEEIVDGHTIVDALTNVSSTIRKHEQFKLWHIQQQLHHEEGQINNNNNDLTGGWVLDKFKMLPAFAHAFRRYPDKKWYIMIDGDSFIFWHSMLRWLNSLNHQNIYYFGSINQFVDDLQKPTGIKEGLQIAHGGSGIILSQAAMARSFGADPNIEHQFDSEAVAVCCGDVLLGHALARHGITLSMQKEGSRMRIQGEPPARLPISGGNWCEPLLTWHHVTQEDVKSLHQFELQHESTYKNIPVRYHHIYDALILPHLEPIKFNWDNLSGDKSVENITVEGCPMACQNWSECAQWRYAGNTCWLNNVILLGYEKVNTSVTSGWHLERIRQGLSLRIQCNKTDI